MMISSRITLFAGIFLVLGTIAAAEPEGDITLKVEVSGSADELQPLLDALREMERRQSTNQNVIVEQEIETHSAMASPDISGPWTVDGRRPQADGSARLMDSDTARISIDGQEASIAIDGKTLTGHYMGGVLTADLETDKPATGRSGKGRTIVDQVWSVELRVMPDGSLAGQYAVTHSGFQASENYKNSTQIEPLKLRRR